MRVQRFQQFNLKDHDGTIAPYKIPTIVEMFKWGKNKAVLNLDNKDNYPHRWDFYIKQLKEGDWHQYKNLILSVSFLKEAVYCWENGVTDRMFYVEIS